MLGHAARLSRRSYPASDDEIRAELADDAQVRFLDNETGGLRWAVTSALAGAFDFAIIAVYCAALLTLLYAILIVAPAPLVRAGLQLFGLPNTFRPSVSLGVTNICSLPTIDTVCDAWPLLSTLAHAPFVIIGAAGAVVGAALGLFVAVSPKHTKVRAFAYIDRMRGARVLIFRGSTFEQNFTVSPFFGPLLALPRHFGFWRCWRQVRKAARQWLSDNPAGGLPLVIAGHSLGGALSQIAAFDLADDHEIRLVASFGSSPVGRIRSAYDRKPAAGPGMRTLGSVTCHFTCQSDFTPRLAPPGLFSHVGQRFWVLQGNDILTKRPSFAFDNVMGLLSRRIAKVSERAEGNPAKPAREETNRRLAERVERWKPNSRQSQVGILVSPLLNNLPTLWLRILVLRTLVLSLSVLAPLFFIPHLFDQGRAHSIKTHEAAFRARLMPK